MTVERASVDDFSVFVRVKSLSEKTVKRAKNYAQVWGFCIDHNHRFHKPDEGYHGFDSSRIHLNRVLRGSNVRKELFADVANRLADVKMRANAKVGIELIMSLHAGTPIDQDAYFDDCVNWADKFFGVHIVSAVSHGDQENRHVHILMLPVKDGRLCGTDLVGGGPVFLRSLNDKFYEDVAKGYGLPPRGQQKRLGGAVRREAVAAARRALSATYGLPEPLLNAIFTSGSNIEAVLSSLQIPVPQVKVAGSFVATMCKKIRTEKTSTGFRGQSALGEAGTSTKTSTGFDVPKRAENTNQNALYLFSAPPPNRNHH